MLLTTTWYGTFIVDPDSGAVIKKKLFQKNVNRLVGHLHAIQNREILPEERNLVKGFKEPLNVTDSRLRGLGGFVDAVEPLPDSVTLSPEDYGFEPELYHQVMLELGKLRTREAIGEDSYIIQAVKGLDELTQTANLLSERLHEWYGLHWPELGGAVNETDYVHLISELGDRAAILKKSGNQNVKNLSTMDSVGVDFNPEDKNAVIGFAQQLENVHTSKITLENYIKIRMENLAPNLTSLIGPIIGARLISLTGSLSRLSIVSSS
jgi:nucleolar protein 56